MNDLELFMPFVFSKPLYDKIQPMN